MSDVQSSRDGASSVTGTSVASRHGAKADQSAASRRISVNRRPSIAGFSHHSNVGGRHGFHQNTVKYENTYRLEPDDRCKFHPTMVSEILASLLESFLDGELYEPLKCAQISQNLTQVINGRMKELSLPRYRFVIHVMIGQNSNQGINYASRSIWNTSTDNFSSATYRNGSLFAIATVFAVYFE